MPMPSLIWIDMVALAIAINACTALTMVTISNTRMRTYNYFFGLFCITQALSALSGLLTSLFLQFLPGDPEFFLEFNALAFSVSSIFLLLFAVNFTERSHWHQSIAYHVAGAGFLSLLVIAFPLFQDKVIYNPQIGAAGVVVADISSLGFLIAAIPLTFLLWSIVIFWHARNQLATNSFLTSVSIIFAGFLIDGLLNVPLPILSIMTALGMISLGIGVLRRQLFNPLRALTEDLEQKVLERTKTIENAYAELETQVTERAAAQERAEIAQGEAERANIALQAQIWLATGLSQLDDMMRGKQSVTMLADNIIRYLCTYVDAHIGALYVQQDGCLKLTGSYAHPDPKSQTATFDLGEGLVGQAALEKTRIMVNTLPEDYVSVNSALLEVPPNLLAIFPFLYNDDVIGVIELGSLHTFEDHQLAFLDTAMETIAIAMNATLDQVRIEELLAKTQQQTEELQMLNETLTERTETLQQMLVE